MIIDIYITLWYWLVG